MRITGLFLAFSLLSLYSTLLFRDVFLERARLDLNRSDRIVFVELESALIQDTMHDRVYLITYSGKYSGRQFRQTEKVDSDYFHSHSEGKNVEAYISEGPGSQVNTRLRGNRIEPGHPFPLLMNISLFGGIGALIVFLSGSGIRQYQRITQKGSARDDRYDNPVRSQSPHS